MKRLKMRAEMTPKEWIAHWALDTIKFITLFASLPLALAARAWPMVVGAVIAHQLRSRGGGVLVGFLVFILFNRKLCQPVGDWVIERVSDFHAWLDQFDPAIFSDDSPTEQKTPPASASTLEKYLAAAREQQAWANREKEKPAAHEKAEQAAYEKAMQEERERAAEWIEDNKDEIKAFAKSTEERDKAKRKRTRIVVVLAVVLAVLLLAAFGGLLGDVLLYLLFLFLVGDPVLLFSAMCLYGKVKNERLRIILSAVTALVIATLVWHSMVYNPPAGSEPSWFDYHPLV